MFFLTSVYLNVSCFMADTLHRGFIGVENSLRLYIPGCWNRILLRIWLDFGQQWEGHWHVRRQTWYLDILGKNHKKKPGKAIGIFRMIQKKLPLSNLQHEPHQTFIKTSYFYLFLLFPLGKNIHKLPGINKTPTNHGQNPPHPPTSKALWSSEEAAAGHGANKALQVRPPAMAKCIQHDLCVTAPHPWDWMTIYHINHISYSH